MTISVGDLLGLGLADKTARRYASLICRAELLLLSRGKTLADCDGADVAAFTATVKASNSCRAQLRASLRAAWEIIDRPNPPLRAVRVPPKPKSRCRALEEVNARLLEQAAWDRNDDPGLAVLIGLYAALRRSEIATLAWCDVLADELGEPAWLRVHGKGELVADVPVHPVLGLALERRRRPNGFLFPGRSGGHVNPATIWNWCDRVAADAGLEVSTHVLRHTALAECNDRTGDLRAVQEIARHARPETTSGYTRVTSARLRRVIATIDYGRRLAGQEEVA